MTHLHLLLAQALIALRAPRHRDARGDVPGWVMITVMTVGIVAALSTFVGPELIRLLKAAFDEVR
jgi:hypothetical protein